jgi:hypothetical protein
MREATMADGLFSIALCALLDSGADVDEGELDMQFGTHSTWAGKLEGARVKPAAPSAKRALSAVLEPGPGKSEPTMAVCDGDMVVHAARRFVAGFHWRWPAYWSRWPPRRARSSAR